MSDDLDTSIGGAADRARIRANQQAAEERAEADPPCAGKSLADIVRERWETGAYGSSRFVMAYDTVDALPKAAPQPGFQPPDGLRGLLSIPIVVDESLPDGAWRLVDGTTGDVLFEGSEEAATMDN